MYKQFLQIMTKDLASPRLQVDLRINHYVLKKSVVNCGFKHKYVLIRDFMKECFKKIKKESLSAVTSYYISQYETSIHIDYKLANPQLQDLF